ncbi:MAG: hypothetical protein ACE5GX_18700 [Thermoanaerobaculia bacterium]
MTATMHPRHLDRWTQEILGTAVTVVRRSGRPLDDADELRELSLAVRAVLSRELGGAKAKGALLPGLAEEIALSVYLALASQASSEDLSPQLLAELHRSLSRTLRLLTTNTKTYRRQGGMTMRKSLATTFILFSIAVLMPPRAEAVPEFAKQWASSCASCHVGAPTSLDEEGVAFRLAGYEQAIDAKNPRPWLFFSFVTDAVTYTSNDTDDDMETPDNAQLFSLLRLDNKGVAKIFAIGELNDTPEGLELDFAHGHLQLNPLEEGEDLNVRLGNIEPMPRMWNTDMRRVFETPLWGGVNVATGMTEAGGGGHGHGPGSSDGVPGVLPASDWGGDVSSVVGRNLLVSGGYAGDSAYAGVFWKKGGRAFDNSTVAAGFDYGSLSDEEKQTFNKRQTNMAKKWERSVIFGVSGYIGDGNQDVFDGAFLGTEGGLDEHDEEGGDEHGEEGEEGHDDEPGHADSFLPARISGTQRLVGEIKTRWDRWGVYAVAVYGVNDYEVGDGPEWNEHGEFARVTEESNNFAAWALESSLRFKIDPLRTARVALRYEELRPEDRNMARFERAVVNFTVPIRIMRPALWPYFEFTENFRDDDSEYRVGLRFAY